MEKDTKHTDDKYIQQLSKGIVALLILLCGLLISYLFSTFNFGKKLESSTISHQPYKPEEKIWTPISMDAALHEKDPALLHYGRELIANTALYLGPKGKVAQITNGMNCQNCHLEAGSKVWGNNYAGVASTYPKFRERSGGIESIYKRVSDCMERSLNGKTMDSSSREMQAMIAYIQFLGKYVPKDRIPKGTGIWKLKYLNRAADPARGQIAYNTKCTSCHANNGQGLLAPNGITYTYPPLWGPHSYNIGAGLFRLSRFAGYIKTNMPFGATHKNPQLSDEEAWDIAAFVNSQPRPNKDLSKDWPKIAGKPVDHPFGPYADGYSEHQHKYGPFQPIEDFKKAQKKKKELAEKVKLL